MARDIDKIIIHCSATPEGRDVKTSEIKRWHTEDNGWRDIGYHFVIELDGSIHKGRAVGTSGAHTVGENHNIGICYVGGMDKDMQTSKDTRTDAQRIALEDLIEDIREEYPNIMVYGHRDFAKKDCPSFDARSEYNEPIVAPV
tara:strand:- start:81 stop:509 length:429 start_codon:yes stop_codon:yes gene_type:complete